MYGVQDHLFPQSPGKRLHQPTSEFSQSALNTVNAICGVFCDACSAEIFSETRRDIRFPWSLHKHFLSKGTILRYSDRILTDLLWGGGAADPEAI
jgi:hypothetical protein